jgi:PAS domain S-box-containing protein
MANYKILLVEDDGIEAMDIKRRLESFGYEVPYVASRGEEVIDKALDISPDLILMDITLKGEIDGIQAASRIKKIGIPVIYLTAHSDESTVQRAKVTEPYAYIIKPFDSLELKYAIEIALYKKSVDKLRIKAENDLKMANLYNRSLIEVSLDPLVTIGPEGKITDVNNATEKITGYSRDELIGTDFSVYFTEPEKARKGYQHVFNEGMVRDYSLEIRNKNGDVTPVLYNASVYRDQSGKVVGVFAAARDITERKRTENILQARYRLLKFANSHSLDELLTAALDEIELLTGSKISFYHFLEPDQKTLSLQNWSSNTLKKMCNAEGKGRHYDITQAGVWVECVHKRRPVIHNDYNSLSYRKGLPEGHAPVIRELVVPIFRGNLIKAIIGVGNKSSYYDENDIETLSQLGDLSWDITERKIAEEELKNANLYNRSLIEVSLDPLVTIGLEGKITDVNKATEKITGYSRDELIGTDFSDYFMEPDNARKGYQRVFMEGMVRDYPLEIRNKNGDVTPVLYNASVYRDESGAVVGAFAAARDITERKQVEKALKASEEKYRSIFEDSFDGLFITSPEGKILDMNKKGIEMFGYHTKDDVRDLDLTRDIYANPKDRIRIISMVNEQGSAEYEVVVKKKNGDKMITQCSLTAVKDESGLINSYRGIIRDITERKKADERIQMLARIVESSDDAIISKSLKGIITSWNKGAENIYGYSAEEIIGKNVSLLAPKQLKNEIMELIKTIKRGERVFHYETIRVRKDGEKINVSLTLSPIFDGSRNLMGISTIARDITGRKKADEALRLSNIYNRSLIEASLDPLVTIGPDGAVTDVNMATEKVTGYSRVELLGSDFSVYFTEPEKAREGYQRVFKEGFVRDYPLKIQHKNGDVTPVLYNASVYRDESGVVVGVFAAARDVTKLNKAENDLKKTIKEKNLLLSEVHHRVKNNMQIISSLLNLQTNYVTDDKTINILKESQDRVKAMAILYEKLYLSDDLTEINFEEYIQGLLKGLFYTNNVEEGQVGVAIEIDNIFLNIETSIPCGLIVSELVSNSLKHAFPKGVKGKIRLSLKSVGDKFELIVSDNGIGFPKDLDFRNTGSLGLQLVNSLVNQIDGEISLDKSDGTRFKILFNELKYKKRI